MNAGANKEPQTDRMQDKIRYFHSLTHFNGHHFFDGFNYMWKMKSDISRWDLLETSILWKQSIVMGRPHVNSHLMIFPLDGCSFIISYGLNQPMMKWSSLA